MAKFLTTNGMSYELEELIKGAKEKLFLLSPFLKMNDRLRSLLEDKDRMKLDIRFVYGKNELQPDETQKLRQLQSVRLSFCKNLHAKCYLSEERAIIGSMNLYEFSQQNNEEMGILVRRAEDPELFTAIHEDAQRILRSSEDVAITIEKAKPAAVSEKPKKAKAAKKETGFCIRCEDEIPFNPERPYCAKDYKAWAKWSNPDYEDAVCHACGDEFAATMNEPLCSDCSS